MGDDRIDNPQDWLNLDSQKAREENYANAIEFAQLYLVLADTERGRALLEHWDKVHLKKRTPVNADIQQYAADEAIRAFVGGIHGQIELARSRNV